MLATETKFTVLDERFEGSGIPSSPMYQQAGRVKCSLVYLHTNGEVEGFVAYGDTEEESENRCLNRMSQKLGHYVGQGLNTSRVHGPEILNKMSGFEARLLMDDFLLSSQSSKY